MYNWVFGPAQFLQHHSSSTVSSASAFAWCSEFCEWWPQAAAQPGVAVADVQNSRAVMLPVYKENAVTGLSKRSKFLKEVMQSRRLPCSAPGGGQCTTPVVLDAASVPLLATTV